MNVPEVLVSTKVYLQQLAEAATQDVDPIDVPDLLLQEIDIASEAVGQELEGKLKRTIPSTFNGNSEFYT
jgi:hypothetical protein